MELREEHVYTQVAMHNALMIPGLLDFCIINPVIKIRYK